MSSIISGVTRQKFINFLHDIATSSPLLTLTFRRWYCNSFTNDSAKNESGISRHSWHFPKINIDCHDNIHRQIGKQGTDLTSALKALSYGENIAKIRPVCPDIFNEIRLFLTMSYLTLSNELHYLWSCRAEVNHIFTQCSHIISAVNRTFTQRYCNSFSNDSAKNASGISRRSWHFPLIAMATSLDKSENKV